MTQRRQHLASRLALAGAALGVLAGLLELGIGPHIRDWVGNKQDTTRLGLTTIALSAIALSAAAALHRPREPTAGRRVAIALGLVVPALVGFTTVGRLWYLPGMLLLSAAGISLAGARPRELATAFDQRRWSIGLLVACGMYYVFLGATALGLAGALGILGGALVWAAAGAVSLSPRTAHALLIGGALPFAAATWWSAVTPLVAVLIIVIGHGVVRRRGRSRIKEPRGPHARRDAVARGTAWSA